MKKPMLYLDTTVPSAFWDNRTPDRQQLTKEFWEKRLIRYDPVISVMVLREIYDTPDIQKRQAMLDLVAGIIVLPFEIEALQLAKDYMVRGIIPEKFGADANHVAIAVSNGIAYFASWNFKHLVRINVRREINLINALNGYGNIEIAAPPEF
ncbi:MAG TPA: hypothetical protein PLI09_00040 [Candidatus Hydrogenedentes bacterium]|nr:hypothetical protein [Candidatus Hydrogenedentota bacterium]